MTSAPRCRSVHTWARAGTALVLLGALAVSGPKPALAQASSSLEVHYPLPEAYSVTLIWGLGAGWHPLPESVQPPGTILRRGLMHTPLRRESGGFTITVTIPAESHVNYCFQVVGVGDGAFHELYDTNGEETRDYHVHARSNEIVTIEPKVSLPGPAHPSLTSHVISYDAPDAAFVSLFWSVNDRVFIPHPLAPRDTVVQGERLRTAMERSGNHFQARLQVPVGARIDFGFLIEETREGQAVHVWDGGPHEGYFRSVAEVGGATEISGTDPFDHDPKSHPSRFRLILLLLGLFVGPLVVVGALPRLTRPRNRPLSPPGIEIAATFISAGLVLLAVRAQILEIRWSGPHTLGRVLLDGLAGGYADLRVFATVAAIFLAAVAVSRSARGHRLLSRLFTGVALVFVGASFFNASAMPLLGGPLNYQWLYYSDFLHAGDSWAAIQAHLTGRLVLALLGTTALLVVFRNAVAWALRRFLSGRFARPGLIVLTAVAVLYPGFATERIQTRGWESSTLANPVSEFVGSLVSFACEPRLFTMPTSIGPEDFATLEERGREARLVDGGEGAVRNVILYVMESVGARYLDMYGGGHAVMPELSRRLGSAIIFENIYCHAPATNKSLVSLHTSTFPWISYRSLTAEFPGIPLTAVTTLVEERGYRTAFFNAGDNRFQNADEFLSHRGYDEIIDYRDLFCERETFAVEDSTWEFMNGVDDRCLVDALRDWQSVDPDAPFFATLWGFQTHYPYFVSGSQTDPSPEPGSFDGYLRTLRHTDAILGDLFRWLDGSGLTDSTLVVIVGDHGEAFGQHDQYGHASHLYEENVHIPLILVNHRLFQGERSETLGGLIDLAPTITDILGIPPAGSWQGQSLLDEERRGSVYFFAPWSDRTFGFREGRWKLLYNATERAYELYDLETDPGETRNLAATNPSRIAEGTERLAAWVQYQERHVKALTENPCPPER